MELLILCAGAGEKAWHGMKSDRPLRTAGKRQAQKIGAHLGRGKLRPDIILTDGSHRSVVSAEKALKAAGWTARKIASDSGLAVGALPELSGSKRALLVALPAAVRVLSGHLALDPPPDIRPGVLFRLALNGGRPRLTTCTDARDLPDLFPYPAPDGPESRERPAYYYRQSAVIPFRRTAAGTQVLVVGSSGGRHWTVPKGIVEPGLSAAASAKVEAWEEAGVEGRVVREPLGSFNYEKWGATCAVTVFAMEVTRVLDETLWEERHRTRKWASREEAASLLKQPAFGAMVAAV
ncbi:NUDIX hydrolase [Roseibium aggregatum]|uniref:NUDIX domain-containing protein n=1 Tax=Roseibium aggregatum TaxID=187304 RepID=A0A939EGS1_9HYPH|nr:NUDIX domain-containing protein [Roseibium aggregatum]MBN9672916.1 NUDIX domain-containing protein [Roseibium aggregatum]